jgi:hypothetical protein
MDLHEIFKNISHSLRARFKETEAGKHGGSKGRKREDIVREFLKEYLPKSCEVTSGEIFNEYGSISKQIDIILHEASMPALRSSELGLFPAKGVIATCEVKTSLDKKGLKEAVLNIEKTKCIAGIQDTRTGAPKQPVYGAIFAFKGSKSKTIKDNLLKLYEEHKIMQQHYIDLICVLNKYVGFNVSALGLKLDDKHRALADQQAVFVECGEDSLLYFLVILLQCISLRTNQDCGLWEYLPHSEYKMF